MAVNTCHGWVFAMLLVAAAGEVYIQGSLWRNRLHHDTLSELEHQPDYYDDVIETDNYPFVNSEHDYMEIGNHRHKEIWDRPKEPRESSESLDSERDGANFLGGDGLPVHPRYFHPFDETTKQSWNEKEHSTPSPTADIRPVSSGHRRWWYANEHENSLSQSTANPSLQTNEIIDTNTGEIGMPWWRPRTRKVAHSSVDDMSSAVVYESSSSAWLNTNQLFTEDDRGVSTMSTPSFSTSPTKDKEVYELLETELLVYISGVKGRVCGDAFTEREARVACHRLGYSRDGATVKRVYQGRRDRSLVVWFRDLKCIGTEETFSQCQYTNIVHNYCLAKHHITVTCQSREENDHSREAIHSREVEVSDYEENLPVWLLIVIIGGSCVCILGCAFIAWHFRLIKYRQLKEDKNKSYTSEVFTVSVGDNSKVYANQPPPYNKQAL